MSRKGKNIHKRKDGRWEARYIISHDDNGRAKYKSVYIMFYTEAKKKRQDALLRLSKMYYEDQPKAGTVESVSRA